MKTSTIKKDSVQLDWGAPEKLNGKILGSRVFYTFKGDPEKTKSLEVGANNRSFRLAGLFPFVKYTVRIQEQTEAGYGPNATITVTTKKSGMKLYHLQE